MQLKLKPGSQFFFLSDIRALRWSCINLLSPLHSTRSILTQKKKLNNLILPHVDKPTWKPWNSRWTSSFKHLWIHMKITFNQTNVDSNTGIYSVKENWDMSEVCRDQHANKMTHAHFSAKCRFPGNLQLWSWSQLYRYLYSVVRTTELFKCR